ncbi:uncharacterized protein AB675_6010 [Cyphellophora attinorum]|uniref:Uncharacterized protein n=1 Tax=Cyphellophora attinorum TaxID=1664694 RepID=A0A0N1H4F0_9EURO|nr:uncharacterized protein AB675_6010 [Phialophora attinorum]KPI36895.1 hypothetical protein AB675_6010 [Phialophora attinorum]
MKFAILLTALLALLNIVAVDALTWKEVAINALGCAGFYGAVAAVYPPARQWPRLAFDSVSNVDLNPANYMYPPSTPIITVEAICASDDALLAKISCLPSSEKDIAWPTCELDEFKPANATEGNTLPPAKRYKLVERLRFLSRTPFEGGFPFAITSIRSAHENGSKMGRQLWKLRYDTTIWCCAATPAIYICLQSIYGNQGQGQAGNGPSFLAFLRLKFGAIGSWIWNVFLGTLLHYGFFAPLRLARDIALWLWSLPGRSVRACLRLARGCRNIAVAAAAATAVAVVGLLESVAVVVGSYLPSKDNILALFSLMKRGVIWLFASASWMLMPLFHGFIWLCGNLAWGTLTAVKVVFRALLEIWDDRRQTIEKKVKELVKKFEELANIKVAKEETAKLQIKAKLDQLEIDFADLKTAHKKKLADLKTDHKKEVADLKASIKKGDDMMNKLRWDTDDCEAQLTQKDEELKEKDAQIKEKDAQINTMQRGMKNLNSRIRDQDSEAVKKIGRVEQLEKELRDAKASKPVITQIDGKSSTFVSPAKTKFVAPAAAEVATQGSASVVSGAVSHALVFTKPSFQSLQAVGHGTSTAGPSQRADTKKPKPVSSQPAVTGDDAPSEVPIAGKVVPSQRRNTRNDLPRQRLARVAAFSSKSAGPKTTKSSQKPVTDKTAPSQPAATKETAPSQPLATKVAAVEPRTVESKSMSDMSSTPKPAAPQVTSQAAQTSQPTTVKAAGQAVESSQPAIFPVSNEVEQNTQSNTATSPSEAASVPESDAPTAPGNVAEASPSGAQEVVCEAASSSTQANGYTPSTTVKESEPAVDALRIALPHKTLADSKHVSWRQFPPRSSPPPWLYLSKAELEEQVQQRHEAEEQRLTYDADLYALESAMEAIAMSPKADSFPAPMPAAVSLATESNVGSTQQDPIDLTGSDDAAPDAMVVDAVVPSTPTAPSNAPAQPEILSIDKGKGRDESAPALAIAAPSETMEVDSDDSISSSPPGPEIAAPSTAPQVDMTDDFDTDSPIKPVIAAPPTAAQPGPGTGFSGENFARMTFFGGGTSNAAASTVQSPATQPAFSFPSAPGTGFGGFGGHTSATSSGSSQLSTFGGATQSQTASQPEPPSSAAFKFGLTPRTTWFATTPKADKPSPTETQPAQPAPTFSPSGVGTLSSATAPGISQSTTFGSMAPQAAPLPTAQWNNSASTSVPSSQPGTSGTPQSQPATRSSLPWGRAERARMLNRAKSSASSSQPMQVPDLGVLDFDSANVTGPALASSAHQSTTTSVADHSSAGDDVEVMDAPPVAAAPPPPPPPSAPMVQPPPPPPPSNAPEVEMGADDELISPMPESARLAVPPSSLVPEVQVASAPTSTVTLPGLVYLSDPEFSTANAATSDTPGAQMDADDGTISPLPQSAVLAPPPPSLVPETQTISAPAPTSTLSEIGNSIASANSTTGAPSTTVRPGLENVTPAPTNSDPSGAAAFSVAPSATYIKQGLNNGKPMLVKKPKADPNAMFAKKKTKPVFPSSVQPTSTAGPSAVSRPAQSTSNAPTQNTNDDLVLANRPGGSRASSNTLGSGTSAAIPNRTGTAMDTDSIPPATSTTAHLPPASPIQNPKKSKDVHDPQSGPSTAPVRGATQAPPLVPPTSIQVPQRAVNAVRTAQGSMVPRPLILTPQSWHDAAIANAAMVLFGGTNGTYLLYQEPGDFTFSLMGAIVESWNNQHGHRNGMPLDYVDFLGVWENNELGNGFAKDPRNLPPGWSTTGPDGGQLRRFGGMLEDALMFLLRWRWPRSMNRPRIVYVSNNGFSANYFDTKPPKNEDGVTDALVFVVCDSVADDALWYAASARERNVEHSGEQGRPPRYIGSDDNPPSSGPDLGSSGGAGSGGGPSDTAAGKKPEIGDPYSHTHGQGASAQGPGQSYQASDSFSNVYDAQDSMPMDTNDLIHDGIATNQPAPAPAPTGTTPRGTYYNNLTGRTEPIPEGFHIDNAWGHLTADGSYWDGLAECEVPNGYYYDRSVGLAIPVPVGFYLDQSGELHRNEFLPDSELPAPANPIDVGYGPAVLIRPPPPQLRATAPPITEAQRKREATRVAAEHDPLVTGSMYQDEGGEGQMERADAATMARRNIKIPKGKSKVARAAAAADADTQRKLMEETKQAGLPPEYESDEESEEE